MEFTIRDNDGFSWINDKIQSNSKVDAEIHLWLAYVASSFFSIDSDAGCGAPDCWLRGIYGEKCNYHFGNRVPIVRVYRTCDLSSDLVHQRPKENIRLRSDGYVRKSRRNQTMSGN